MNKKSISGCMAGVVLCSIFTGCRADKEDVKGQLICQWDREQSIRDLAVNDREDVLYITSGEGELFKSVKSGSRWEAPVQVDCGAIGAYGVEYNNEDGRLYFTYFQEEGGQYESGFYSAEEEDGVLTDIVKLEEVDFNYLELMDIKNGKMLCVAYDTEDSQYKLQTRELSQKQIKTGKGPETLFEFDGLEEFPIDFEWTGEELLSLCDYMGESEDNENVYMEGAYTPEGDYTVKVDADYSFSLEEEGEREFKPAVRKLLIKDLSGKELWGYSLEDIVAVDSNEEGDKIYYGCEDGCIYVKETETGKEKCTDGSEGENKAETEPYEEGEKTYDAYDVGNFEPVTRDKGFMEKKQGIYYEIFVRSFADSDGDGIGDFNGVAQKLDYLADLGISGIYLMPVNKSSSYHGYDTEDYGLLNEEYGTEEEFKALIEEAHKRGIKIIMDFVMNHTGTGHPWFQEALADENSEYRNFYRFVAGNDTRDFDGDDCSFWGSEVWNEVSGNDYYYGIFGGDMPDLNYNNPKVREAMKASAAKWLGLGIDGFRLDAAMHIYGIHEFKQQGDNTEANLQWWNEFAAYCESINPEVYLVGEIWQEEEVQEAYVQPFDTKFDFTFQQNMLEAVKNGTALAKGKNLSQLMEELLETYQRVDTDYLNGIFGSNHDQNRIMSEVGEEAKARIVAAIYLTLPGNPFLYYGEEIGMKGEKPDEDIRTPFLWGEGAKENTTWEKDTYNARLDSLEEQKKDENSVYHFYKKLIALRNSSKALSSGDYAAVDMKDDGIMAYVRQYGGEKALVIHNLSSEGKELDLSGYAVKEIFLQTGETSVSPEGNARIGGMGSLILEIS